MAPATRILTATGAALVGVGMLWVLLGPLPSLLGGADLRQLDPAERFTAISTIRGQIGTVISAAFVAGGLFYTGKRYFLDRDKQFTDRFNAAVDHLGSDNDIVRAGGVRALDRILRDSPTDRNRVVESLTQFIRRHSSGKTIPDDVTAAIAAVRNRPTVPKNVEEDPLDLHGAHLPTANLRGATLDAADLTRATLTEANLSAATMTHAQLNHAALIKTNLTNAALRHADLRSAQLTEADLTSADLTNADLTDAGIRRATLTRTDLTGAILVRTDLRGADLRDAIGLTNPQLSRATVDEHTRLPAAIEHPLDGPI